jgi:hypothetical protein
MYPRRSAPVKLLGAGVRLFFNFHFQGFAVRQTQVSTLKSHIDGGIVKAR